MKETVAATQRSQRSQRSQGSKDWNMDAPIAALPGRSQIPIPLMWSGSKNRGKTEQD